MKARILVSGMLAASISLFCHCRREVPEKLTAEQENTAKANEMLRRQKLLEAKKFMIVCESVVPQWNVAEAGVYTPESLYERIDGGADALIAIGFKELLAYQCIGKTEPAPNVLIDIYEMKDVDAAKRFYNMHVNSKKIVPKDLGDEAAQDTNTLQLRRQNFVVLMMGLPGEEGRKAMLEMARLVADKL